MEENKEWWQSRTIWMGILTSGCALARGLNLLPESFDHTLLDEAVTFGLGIATVVFRILATKQVTVVPAVVPEAPKA